MPDTEDKAGTPEQQLLTKVRKRYRVMTDADDHNRRDGMYDFKFINLPGWQWDENMKKERGQRPCYEFNKLRVTSKRIINDMKANPAQPKVRGVEGGDKDIAELQEGLIRNIWNISNADSIIDTAAEYQVGAGMGAWRVITEFSTDTAFEQDILIEGIPNSFCLYCDPAAKNEMKRDAMDWIVTERIANSEYEERWPKAEKVEFEGNEFDDDDEWQDDETTRIAEYWWKEPTTKEIWQLQNGQVIDSETDEAAAIEPALIKRKRKVKTHQIKMAIVSGESVLEGPTDWAGTIFPFIMIFGEYLIIDGKAYWYGVGRFGKDPQRSYNVSRTSITETIAMAPSAKWWATTKQAAGQTDIWDEAHLKNFPYLLYNPDPTAPGPPQRMSGADVPIALIQESQIASEEINMVTGIFAADVGAANQASSGRQEIARQQQGQIATFNYQDNRGKGIQLTYEIILDLIPKIYDTEREIRILGSDDSEDYKRVNTFVKDEEGNDIKINDLAVGKYDVVATLGRSFATKRQEAAETYRDLLQSMPAVGEVAGDLIFKSMDLPFSEDIAERLKSLLPPEIQNLINEEQEVPPEVQLMITQAEQALNAVEEQAQAVQQAAQQVELDKAEVEKLTAQLETNQAKFEAEVAKEVANITKLSAQLTEREIKVEKDNVIQEGQAELDEAKQEFNVELAEAVSQALQGIAQLVGEFNQNSIKAIEEIKSDADKKPKIVKITSKRVNGVLEAIPVFEETE